MLELFSTFWGFQQASRAFGGPSGIEDLCPLRGACGGGSYESSMEWGEYVSRDPWDVFMEKD